VAKFSPKSIHVGTADNTSNQVIGKELHNEVTTTFASADHLDKDALNPTNSQSALL